jgi:dye decolorizing peroxidase
MRRPVADPDDGRGPQLSRRGLLGALGVGVGALATGAGAPAAAAATGGDTSVWAPTTESFFGEHQAGIATAPQAQIRFVALDLRPGLGREGIVRLMRLLTDDIERLTTGRAALADPTPQLAGDPGRLTVTVGFGHGLLAVGGLLAQAPSWLADGLPAFSNDHLLSRWSGGDLLLQVGGDNPMAVSHAAQVLVTDADTFASVRWAQSGFHRAGSDASAPIGPSGQLTGRNLFGQVDGTVNPVAGTDDFDQVVWVGSHTGGAATPAWLVGGTALVLRRIAMDLRTWGSVDRTAKEEAVGRRLSDGAPLTGGGELTAPDYDAVDSLGFPVIPATSHIRLAHPVDPKERILRRPYSYDDGMASDGSPDAGLLFAAYMADPQAQFVPIQRRLAEADLLNLWTRTIGSALFAVPPGVQQGGIIGQSLLGG